MCEVDELTDDTLEKMIHIRRIDCSVCEYVTTGGYLALILESKKLEQLIISYEKRRTREFLETAVIMTDGGYDNRILKIGFDLVYECMESSRMEKTLNNLVAHFNRLSTNLRVFLT